MRINFLFLRRVGVTSRSTASCHLHSLGSLVGEVQSGWSFDHPTVELLPTSPLAVLPWIARVGTPRSCSSPSPPSRAGSLCWHRGLCQSPVRLWGSEAVPSSGGCWGSDPPGLSHPPGSSPGIWTEGLVAGGEHYGYSYS